MKHKYRVEKVGFWKVRYVVILQIWKEAGMKVDHHGYEKMIAAGWHDAHPDELLELIDLSTQGN